MSSERVLDTATSQIATPTISTWNPPSCLPKMACWETVATTQGPSVRLRLEATRSGPLCHPPSSFLSLLCTWYLRAPQPQPRVLSTEVFLGYFKGGETEASNSCIPQSMLTQAP